MAVHRTARARARAEITWAIKDEARRQLGEVGAHALSLRAVARALGMVSSALYRYFPSRDDLVTALLIDAYNSLGEAAEHAAATEQVPRRQWKAVCHAVHRWARARPAEYTLIYGTPIPGYRAPQDTVAPAVRVPQLLIKLLHAAWESGKIRSTDTVQQELTAELRDQLDAVAATFGTELPAPVLHRGLIAWTQLFGMVNFELNGQFVGGLDPTDAFFAHAVERMTDFVGLT